MRTRKQHYPWGLWGLSDLGDEAFLSREWEEVAHISLWWTPNSRFSETLWRSSRNQRQSWNYLSWGRQPLPSMRRCCCPCGGGIERWSRSWPLIESGPWWNENYQISTPIWDLELWSLMASRQLSQPGSHIKSEFGEVKLGNRYHRDEVIKERLKFLEWIATERGRLHNKIKSTRIWEAIDACSKSECE